MPIPTTTPFSWATATAVEISRHCGLNYMPPSLIEQVLLRFKAFLKKSGLPTGANSYKSSPVQTPVPVIGNASRAHQNSLPPSVESELLHAAQLLAPCSAPKQPTPLPPMEHFAMTPATVAPAWAVCGRPRVVEHDRLLRMGARNEVIHSGGPHHSATVRSSPVIGEDANDRGVGKNSMGAEWCGARAEHGGTIRCPGVPPGPRE